MFFVDDLLLSPVKGLAAICRHIRDAAQEDFEKEEKAIVDQLTDLHRMLEGSQISEAEFDDREARLLDKLETLQQSSGPWNEEAS
jgi:hypothetical protein